MYPQILAILLLLSLVFHRRQDFRLLFMTIQNRMLKRRLGVEFIIPNVKERAELIAVGAKFDHDVDDCLEVVTPATYRLWVKDADEGKERVPRWGASLRAERQRNGFSR